jgi:hypothetical protein
MIRKALILALCPIFLFPVSFSTAMSSISTGQDHYNNPIGLSLGIWHELSMHVSISANISTSWCKAEFVDYLHGGFINPFEQSKVSLRLLSRFTVLSVSLQYSILQNQHYQVGVLSGAGFWHISGTKKDLETGETSRVTPSLKGSFSPGIIFEKKGFPNKKVSSFILYTRDFNFGMSSVTDSDTPYQNQFPIQTFNLGFKFRLGS